MEMVKSASTMMAADPEWLKMLRYLRSAMASSVVRSSTSASRSSW